MSNMKRELERLERVAAARGIEPDELLRIQAEAERRGYSDADVADAIAGAPDFLAEFEDELSDDQRRAQAAADHQAHKL